MLSCPFYRLEHWGSGLHGISLRSPSYISGHDNYCLCFPILHTNQNVVHQSHPKNERVYWTYLQNMGKGLLTSVGNAATAVLESIQASGVRTSLVHPGSMQVGHIAHNWLKGMARILGGDLVTLPTFLLEEINSWQAWSWWQLVCRCGWTENGILQNMFSGSHVNAEFLLWFVLLELAFIFSYKSLRLRPKEPHSIFEGCKSFSLDKNWQKKRIVF